MKNQFLDLILSGEILNRDQHVECMREFHNQNTHLSELYFSRSSENGKSTYELLGDAIDIPLTSDFHILDLGCSVGTFYKYLTLKNNSNLHYTGVDISDESIQVAQTRFLNKARFVTAAADSLPFNNSYFDAVVSHMAFSMFKPIKQAMLEALRVLKRGGVFSVILPAVWSKNEKSNTNLSLGVRKIIDEVYPNYSKNFGGFGEPEFFSRESIFEFCSKFPEMSEVSINEIEVDFSGSREEIIWGIKTFYWYQILSDEIKDTIEHKIVDMVSKLDMVEGQIKHYRKMALLRCVKT